MGGRGRRFRLKWVSKGDSIRDPHSIRKKRVMNGAPSNHRTYALVIPPRRTEACVGDGAPSPFDREDYEQ